MSNFLSFHLRFFFQLKAFKWSERAMKMGDLRGWFDVAYSTEFGLGTSMDPANQLRIWCWGKRGGWNFLDSLGRQRERRIKHVDDFKDESDSRWIFFEYLERLCASVCSGSLYCCSTICFSQFVVNCQVFFSESLPTFKGKCIYVVRNFRKDGSLMTCHFTIFQGLKMDELNGELQSNWAKDLKQQALHFHGPLNNRTYHFDLYLELVTRWSCHDSHTTLWSPLDKKKTPHKPTNKCHS